MAHVERSAVHIFVIVLGDMLDGAVNSVSIKHLFTI